MIDFSKKRILLVAAHPDDEILGQGATMHHLIENHSCTIRVIILGQGITARGMTDDKKQWEAALSAHMANVKKVQDIIGFESVILHDFPDNRFDGVNLLDIVKVIEKEKNAFGPEIIFTHHGGDTNIDHRRTFEAVITATRPMYDEPVRHIIAFETFSSTEWQAANYPNPFLPNFFVAVTEQDVNAKVRAMAAYESEARAFPHPRSGEAMQVAARRWGAVVGTGYAEAFMLIRSIALK